MSKTHSVRFVWLAVLTVAGSGVFANFGNGQTSPFDKFDRNIQLKAQKLEQEIHFALGQVQQLEKTDPNKAVNILEVYRAVLQSDTLLSTTNRANLLSHVNARLQQVQRTSDVQQKINQAKAQQTATQEELYKKYVDNRPDKGKSAYNHMKNIQDSIQAGIKNSQSLKELQGERTLVVLNDIERTAVPDIRDFGFPKNWKQLSETRARFTGPKLTEKEQDLLKALNSVMTVDFDMAPLSRVIEYLQETTKQVIVLDAASLREAQVDYESATVTFKSPTKLTFRTVLQKVLGDIGMAYILKDGVIQVVTPQKARDTLVVRSYPIGDLIPLDPNMGQFGNVAMGNFYASQIAQMIQQSVDPGSWAVNGGRGTMFYNPATQSLVISNSAEMHLGFAAGMHR
jgi:hypothetical protein